MLTSTHERILTFTYLLRNVDEYTRADTYIYLLTSTLPPSPQTAYFAYLPNELCRKKRITRMCSVYRTDNNLAQTISNLQDAQLIAQRVVHPCQRPVDSRPCFKWLIQVSGTDRGYKFTLRVDERIASQHYTAAAVNIVRLTAFTITTTISGGAVHKHKWEQCASRLCCGFQCNCLCVDNVFTSP